MLSTLEKVHSTRPAAGYIGGKRNLSRRLVKMISEVDHSIYCEPFVGMGGIFFRRASKPTVEIINDWSQEVSNFFRILQRHYVAFLDMLRFQLTTRAGFNRLKATDPATLTDLERAARFLYLQRTAFGGKVAGQTFGTSPTRAAHFDLTKVVPMLEAIHDRLASVTIECLPWADCISKYDRPGTLFYLDPPYHGCENDYGKDMFNREDFAAIAKQLSDIKGRFILSINDVPEIRQLFSKFTIIEAPTTYQLPGNHNGKLVTELVITNIG